jgi:hypothetical protein
VTLHPSVAAVRLPVRRTLSGLEARAGGRETVAVACSGGADSLALASATLFEGHKLGLRVVGVTVDHGLQPGSDEQHTYASGTYSVIITPSNADYDSCTLGPDAGPKTFTVE